jgi:hypothetical protein
MLVSSVHIKERVTECTILSKTLPGTRYHAAGTPEPLITDWTSVALF